MPLLQAAEILVVVGVLLCLVNPFIPMQSSIKSILNAVGSDCGSCVAAQRVRALSFAIPHAHRIVKDEFRQQHGHEMRTQRSNNVARQTTA